jgi:DNA-binding protein HU-beta
LPEILPAGLKPAECGFEPRDRQAREGRNPRTGKTLTIPATTVPAFSAGKLFKEKVAEEAQVPAKGNR